MADGVCPDTVMSTSSASLANSARASRAGLALRLRAYFFSDRARAAQSVLGALWLLDAGLQFQPFMYTHGFPQTLVDNALGQPGWLHASVIWAARLINADLSSWNTLFALVQVFIGLGILYRPTVRRALGASLAWAFVVWWFGEAFGMLFMDGAQPLTGAPGAVAIYALIALLVWPNGRAGGLLGARGARALWSGLWLLEAWLWLLAPSSGTGATSAMLRSTAPGIGALADLQRSLARAAAGDGLLIALALAALSAAIALAPLVPRAAPQLLGAAIVLSLLYWIIPQGLGGLLSGHATDPGTGPLFVLLACAIGPLLMREPDDHSRAGARP